MLFTLNILLKITKIQNNIFSKNKKKVDGWIRASKGGLMFKWTRIKINKHPTEYVCMYVLHIHTVCMYSRYYKLQILKQTIV